MMRFHTLWLLFKLLGHGEPFSKRFEFEIRAQMPVCHYLARNGSIWVESNACHPVNVWCPWWARPRWWFLKLFTGTDGKDL